MLTHKELKAKALKRADVQAEYDSLDEEFTILDEFLKARAAAGVSQTEVARRIGLHSQPLLVLSHSTANTPLHFLRCANTPMLLVAVLN